ncbi:MAG: GNAT family N-acetyltransferase [Chitinophagaceae bacterium]
MNLQPTHLHNEWVRLQPLTENDFEKLYAVASDPAIWAQHPQHNRHEQKVFQTFFDSAVEGGAAFLVLHAKTGELIGSSRYYDYNAAEKTIAIGFTFLATKYWGGTYNKALKTLMLQYAFTLTDVVLFHVGITNMRSQKALEKLGARRHIDVPVDRSGTPSFEYIICKGEPVFSKRL